MYQMPQSTGGPYFQAPNPPRRRLPEWAFIVSIVALTLCLTSGATVAIIALVRANQPVTEAQTLPASVGESLIINNVTVTLVSATLVDNADFMAVPGIQFSLHFWNQTAYEQTLSTEFWSLLADGGAKSYKGGPTDGATVALEPNQTQNAQFTIAMSVGDHGPYTLQTDFTTSQGQPLAWTFTG